MKEAQMYEFEFGLQYAWILCVFAVVSSYSVLCPLITPFGFIYLLMKYLTVRYNMYFVNAPSKIHIYIHVLAIGITLFNVFNLQINLMVFMGLRFLGNLQVNYSMYFLLIISIVISICIMIFCGAYCVFVIKKNITKQPADVVDGSDYSRRASSVYHDYDLSNIDYEEFSEITAKLEQNRTNRRYSSLRAVTRLDSQSNIQPTFRIIR
ncbi:Transmembrane protein 63C [Cichlidogyrus casuarinus]|uniref:Transmembrane protein 63C n=1 Tax=Cichlidogyrus casuarinus TaxID=1844966 RepID=A0ABD2QG00_9PLAT